MITHRIAFCIGVGVVFFGLLVHDWNLYPNLRPFQVPLLSGLRLFLLAVPLFAGSYIARRRVSGWKNVACWMLWFLFLPYTMYSVTEIRHVAELCSLSRGEVYTNMCVDRLWTLYPVFLYALSGFLIYVFSVIQVASSSFSDSQKKRVFIAAVSLFVSFAAVFGLYTRLNVWDAFVSPQTFVISLLDVLGRTAFFVNLAWSFAFTVLTTFVVNRVLSRAHLFVHQDE